ncbi:MAG TPA: hypothetical protein VN634_20865 [Candidatus Limnocylindrales bacterium]|nr:hypothetical protein [Candidatus Limnocylindrales bacterium]
MRHDDRELATGLLLSCAAAVCGFVAWSWPVALHFSTHTPVIVSADRPPTQAADSDLEKPKAGERTSTDWDLILAGDQSLSLWNTIENARALTSGRWNELLSAGQCYPMPRASTLGEHMIETGIDAAPWWIVTRDPVASYNLALATALVIAASGMFLFLHFHTGSVAASVAGAIAFAFAAPRLADLSYHPAVVGTHWMPWVLWSLDRLLARSSGARVAFFAMTLLLASLVGSYPLLSIAIFGAAYGGARAAARWRDGQLSARSLAAVAVGALPAVIAVAALLATYARVQHDWLLASHPEAKFLAGVTDYLPGGMLSIGKLAFTGLIPLVLIRRDAGRSAVVPLAIATAVAFLLATWIPLPGTDSSLYELLGEYVPLLDSVRAPGKIALAAGFGMQALGAIGWSRLLLGFEPRIAAAIATVLVVFTGVEASLPVARGVLGSAGTRTLREIAPPAQRIEAFDAALGEAPLRQAVLDLPSGRMVKAATALVDAAYHGHPTSACYNSLVAPTMRAVLELGARSHSARGVAELAAAGFGFIVDRDPSPYAADAFPAPARLVASQGGASIWALPAPAEAHHDAAKLEMTLAGGATRRAAFDPEPPYELDVDVTNRGEAMWALAPARPLFAEVELASADGKADFRSRARGMLPLALAAGQTTRVVFVLPQAPEPGVYKAALSLEGSSRVVRSDDFHWVAAAR